MNERIQALAERAGYKDLPLVLRPSLPPQRKPCSCGLSANITAPPQRKPLTDEEIIEAIKHISHNEMSAFAIARVIENVLKNAPSEANKGTYDNP